MAHKNNPWNEVFRNFKRHFPRLSKMADWYRPFIYPLIIIPLSDGKQLLYDDREQRVHFIEEDEDLYKYI